MTSATLTKPITFDEVRVSSFLAGLHGDRYVQVTYEPLNLVVTATNEPNEAVALTRCLSLINRMQTEHATRAPLA